MTRSTCMLFLSSKSIANMVSHFITNWIYVKHSLSMAGVSILLFWQAEHHLITMVGRNWWIAAWAHTRGCNSELHVRCKPLQWWLNYIILVFFISSNENTQIYKYIYHIYIIWICIYIQKYIQKYIEDMFCYVVGHVQYDILCAIKNITFQDYSNFRN